MNTITQIEQGLLVCPVTRQRLHVSSDRQWLVTEDDAHRYRLLNGQIPILLADSGATSQYASASKRMNEEYSLEGVRKSDSLLGRLRQLLNSDYRTEASKQAFERLFADLPSDALCLSIGGGPARAHDRLINLNIGPFPNVDVVADAHQLPYADASVDVIYSEAVFEHLHSPAKAAGEIFRVLKPGSRIFICTPFMFPYHGYPHHYQNYTITGHRHLFEAAGLKVIECGPCVGPAYTLTTVVGVFIREYLPSIIRLPLRILWGVMAVAIRPLDKVFGNRPNAHILAATTYVVAEKSA
ncbi:MAG: methyltransferase domain-containing protein [Nitrosomonadales bacterium]|nr:methyltransferase domain-containing protein [Nitrosomonadales bacterium]